ncbi:hypothetical protein BESB_077620 [Besnoitia besnoiti]|uniref:Chaperone dnaJ, related protein n=1 Tax=Besnoitia besnoiti TaxID=94643 RepID=A0A2A9M6E3_BESBE|nr:hypothetical protein BESB_077620 [Besnoitia besnoiti]PFH33545.1 hypothetical protein BESB_077620 [Besnoitia besnoiti]
MSKAEEAKKKQEDARKEEEEKTRMELVRAQLPPRKKKSFFNWERLSPETTVLLFSTPEQVQLLNETLPFQIANVTMQEHHIAPISSVDRELQNQLLANYTHGMKTLRTTVVFVDDTPITVNNSRPRRGPICQQEQRAMLLSFNRVYHKEDGQAYATFNLHSPSVVTFHRELEGEYNLKALNPFMWTSHFPTEKEFMHFRGTAICLAKGSPMQLLKGWPVTVPEYEDGPWQARVKVLRAFVSASADTKKKNIYVLQATLHVMRQPKDGMFKQQNLDVIPFMGYITIAGNKKHEHLEAAIIRHKLLNKVCTLRRVMAKSQVELKCDDVDAKLAELHEMMDERPVLRETFKKVGTFAGVSMATYGIALVSHLLTSIHRDLMILPQEGLLLTGTGFAVGALLYLLIAGPVVGLQRYKWRREFSGKKKEYLQKVVDDENMLSSASAPVVDMVFVVNELQHADEDDVTATDELKTIEAARQELSQNVVNGTEELSPIAQKIQDVLEQYSYLNTVAPAFEAFTRVSQFAKMQQEVKTEAKALLSFLKRAALRKPEIIEIDKYGKLKLTTRQLVGVHAYLGKEMRADAERNIAVTPFSSIEILISREKGELLRKRIAELEGQIRAQGGIPTAVESADPVRAAKRRLRCLSDSRDKLEEAMEIVEGNSQLQELLFAEQQYLNAKSVLRTDRRVYMDDDLGIAIEEVDNLKARLEEVRNSAGDKPSPLQEAERQEIMQKILALNEKIKTIIHQMRLFGFEVDIRRVVELESE